MKGRRKNKAEPKRWEYMLTVRDSTIVLEGGGGGEYLSHCVYKTNFL
jgi:hypothetical protein